MREEKSPGIVRDREEGVREMVIIEGECPGCGNSLFIFEEFRGGEEEFPPIPEGNVEEILICEECEEFLFEWEEKFGEEEIRKFLREEEGEEGIQYFEEFSHSEGNFWRREEMFPIEEGIEGIKRELKKDLQLWVNSK